MKKHNNERERIRAARYTPGRQYEEELNMTLKNLPKKKRKTLQEKILTSVSIAAAALLFIALAAPPIVRAAGPLIERLFGQVVKEIEQEQTKAPDLRLQEMIKDYESASRWHYVTGASIEVGGVQMSVESIRVMPDEYHDPENPNGQLDITLNYSAIPSFDPCYVDFKVIVDGKELPMLVDEMLQYYRDTGAQTLTEEQWDFDTYREQYGNSELFNGVLSTFITFKLDDWRWDEMKEVTLKANIDGKEISLPFSFDPAKAHEEAIRMAEISVALGEDNYEHEKDELRAMSENAVPVGLTGEAQGTQYAISEFSHADGKLYFTAAFASIEEKNPKLVGLSYGLNEITVDGMAAAMIGSDNDMLENGQYTAIYEAALARDPAKLPETSLIAMDLELGDYDQKERVAFRYNWQKKEALLPENEAEMKAWVEEAAQLERTCSEPYDHDLYYDLSALNLTESYDGVTLTVTGMTYRHYTPRVEFAVRIEGDVKGSKYYWHWSPSVKINGNTAYEDGGGMDANNVMTDFYVKPPLNISEFGPDMTVELDFPLIDKGRNLDETNFPEPDHLLHFEFAIDPSMELQALPNE